MVDVDKGNIENMPTRMDTLDISKLNLERWRRAKRPVRLDLFAAQDGSMVTLPVGIVAGRGSGPIVTVVAGQHGDEWNGVYVCHRLFEICQYADMLGTLVLLPVANPQAFAQKSRISSIDHVDMNRSYGFPAGGKSTEHVSRLLMKHVYAKSGYVVDLHTGGSGEYSPNVGVADQSRLQEAAALGLPYSVVVDTDHTSLMPALERRSIPAITVQMGTSLHIDIDNCELLVEGVINFLRYLGTLRGEAEPSAEPILFVGKELITAPSSGVFQALAGLGETVEEGQLIGQVTPLFSSTSLPVHAASAGVVFYIHRHQIVAQEDELFHIGVAAP